MGCLQGMVALTQTEEEWHRVRRVHWAACPAYGSQRGVRLVLAAPNTAGTALLPAPGRGLQLPAPAAGEDFTWINPACWGSASQLLRAQTGVTVVWG